MRGTPRVSQEGLSGAKTSQGATNPLAYLQNILKGRPIHWPIRGIFSRGDQSIGLSAEYSQGAEDPRAKCLRLADRTMSTRSICRTYMSKSLFTYSPRAQVAIRYIERNERGSAGDAGRIGQWIGRPLRIFRG
eukprot:6350472-Pyramimonas_sp.AAC.1